MGVIKKDLSGEPYHTILADDTLPGFLDVSLRDKLNIKTECKNAQLGILYCVSERLCNFRENNRGVDLTLLYSNTV